MMADDRDEKSESILSNIFSPSMISMMGSLWSAVADAAASQAANRNDGAVKDRTQRFDKVKLIHSSQLDEFEKMPIYRDFHGISLEEYRVHRDRLRKQIDKYAEPLQKLRRLQTIDHNELVEFSCEHIVVPRSFWGRDLQIPISRPQMAQAGVVAHPSEGIVEGANLRIKGTSRRQQVRISYRASSDEFHREEIEAIKADLANLSYEDMRGVEEARYSKFNDPILFISHRWEGSHEPDPHGFQLQKLRSLRDCFIIYDYTSFPQAPLSDDEQKDLSAILSNMTALVENVVIISDDSYALRGWCLYEYLAASLKLSIVCDEIQDPRFRNLRNWVCSKPPPPFNVMHDGAEALIQNHINANILEAINEIVGLYQCAEFSNEQDREIVQRLLVDLLLEKLPRKKIHRPDLDSSSVRWTRAELEGAFSSRLSWEPGETVPQDAFDVRVPEDLADAVARQYRVQVQPPQDYLAMSVMSPLGRLLKKDKSLSPHVF